MPALLFLTAANLPPHEDQCRLGFHRLREEVALSILASQFDQPLQLPHCFDALDVIAGFCPHRLVEHLDVIDVRQQGIVSSGLAAYAREGALQAVQEHSAIGQSREQVVEQVVLQFTARHACAP